MTPTEFALFRYQHTDAATRSPARRWFTGIGFGLALLQIVSRFIEPPFSLLTLLVPLLAWATASRQLLLGLPGAVAASEPKDKKRNSNNNNG